MVENKETDRGNATLYRKGLTWAGFCSIRKHLLQGTSLKGIIGKPSALESGAFQTRLKVAGIEIFSKLLFHSSLDPGGINTNRLKSVVLREGEERGVVKKGLGLRTSESPFAVRKIFTIKSEFGVFTDSFKADNICPEDHFGY